MLAEIRYAARHLRKAPAFTATALATIAICLGANLAIFAVIDSVLLRPLPFPDADRLVTIFNTYPKAGVENDGSSLTNYYERRGHIPAFSSLSIYREDSGVVGEAGSTEQDKILRISPDFFTTLGISPAAGRGFNDSETITPDQNNRVAIVSDAYWRERLNADPHVLGRNVRVNGVEREIVGVLPPDFEFLSSNAELFLPLTSALAQRTPSQRHSGGGATHMIARLQPGVTIAQAQAAIDAHNAAVETDDPQAAMMREAGFRSPVVSLHADHVRSIRPTLLLLQGAVFFLLLIGAVNLANLLLIRANARAKEMAIRQSMGATRAHVVQQVMVETVLLTAAGGVLGLIAGAFGVRLLEILGADRLPLGAHISFDGWAAAAGLAVAILLGVFLALPVVWFNLSSEGAQTLQSESRANTVGLAAQRLRHGFIVAQIALAFVLLSGAALLGLSLKQVMTVAPGFRADHLLTAEFTLPYGPFPQESPERVGVIDRLIDSIDRQPGIAAAGTITQLPLAGGNGKTAITPVDYVPQPGESAHGHYSYGIEGNYFAALGIPLREGRVLTSADSQRPERVCVVDEDFARRYWPAGDAVGHRVYRGTDAAEAAQFTIVGVVGSVKQAALTEAQGQGAVYFPFRDRDGADIFVVTRTSQRPEAFAGTLRTLVRAADPELAVNNIRSMDTLIDDSLLARRSPALLAGLFAVVALLLAAIGTYGVLSYAVAQRRREIGIRMALGAQTAQVRREFLSIGLRLVGGGILLGLAGARVAGGAMQSVLFAVPAFQPLTLAATALVLLAISLVASWLPARRAARIDPAVALRAE